MTKAIILSAGQGRRLLPLTAERPKCLLELAGRSVLEWQLDALLQAGVEQVFVVVGFHADAVEALLREHWGDAPVRALFNPFYDVADNLASCWLARDAMKGDFVLVNGDTVFEPALLGRVLDSPQAPITLTVDRKPVYDDDDMKVQLDGTRVMHVSKTLGHDQVHAESIGLLYFRGDGPALFRAAIERALRHPTSLRLWYLSVVDALAAEGVVHACFIEGLRWGEIDFPPDLVRAQKLFSPAAAAASGRRA